MSTYNQTSAQEVIRQNQVLQLSIKVNELETVINNQGKLIVEIMDKVTEIYNKVNNENDTNVEKSTDKKDELDVNFDN